MEGGPPSVEAAELGLSGVGSDAECKVVPTWLGLALHRGQGLAQTIATGRSWTRIAPRAIGLPAAQPAASRRRLLRLNGTGGGCTGRGPTGTPPQRWRCSRR